MKRLETIRFRIFVELEELRVQNIYSLMNTVFNSKGDMQDLYTYRDALAEFADKGYIVIGVDDKDRAHEDLNSEQTIEFLSHLDELFRYDENTSYWTMRDGDPRTTELPAVILTDKGLQKAIDVLKAQ